jgi:hypothetical protein
MANAVRISNYQRPVDLLEIARRGKPEVATTGTDQTSFKEMFSSELASARDVTFSKHASQRLHSRGIEINDEQMTACRRGRQGCRQGFARDSGDDRRRGVGGVGGQSDGDYGV